MDTRGGHLLEAVFDHSNPRKVRGVCGCDVRVALFFRRRKLFRVGVDLTIVFAVIAAASTGV